MEEWQERLVEEKTDLDTKLFRLNSFLDTDQFYSLDSPFREPFC